MSGIGYHHARRSRYGHYQRAGHSLIICDVAVG